MTTTTPNKMTATLPTKMTLVKDLKPKMRRLSLRMIVLDISEPYHLKDGQDVRTIRVADKSGCVNMSVWGEQGALLKTGDIVRLNNGYTALFKNCLTLYIGRPIGEFYKQGEFCLVFAEEPNMSEPNIFISSP